VLCVDNLFTGTKRNVVWSDGFGSGLGQWTAGQEIKFPGGIGFPWRTITDAPDHQGAVAYGQATDDGVCSNGAGDASSRDWITSPAILIPGAPQKSPRLTFDHTIASEFNVDGGNVSISVNGAPFTLVPTAAYTFNGPNSTLLTAAAGNTNPKAGQRACASSEVRSTCDDGWNVAIVSTHGPSPSSNWSAPSAAASPSDASSNLGMPSATPETEAPSTPTSPTQTVHSRRSTPAPAFVA